MLYRHSHALFTEETNADPTERVGPTFRVRPADGDAPDTLHHYALWSTLTARGPMPGESTDPAARPVLARLIVETSADGLHWLVVDRHDLPGTARLVPVHRLLSFVRARLVVRGVECAATALLLGTGPFRLQAQSRRSAAVVVVGGGA